MTVVPAGSAPLPARPGRFLLAARRLGRSLRTWPFVGEVGVLVGVAAVLQVVFPYRHDWPAHLVAGGAVVLGVAGRLPRRLGPWAGPFGFVVVLVAAVASEVSVFGPFDPVDVAVTLLGALLPAVVAVEVSASGPVERRVAVYWAVLLIACSLAYRFGMDPVGR